ncbi:MAG: DinB family protein [Mucilaginibacter sp.]|nr:DinB family protein [Mucilaginibacter sp.]
MKTMKQLIGIIIISISSIYAVSAQSTDSLQIQLSREWVHSKAYALKLAALMPEKDYDFKPVPSEMSFTEQLLHLADNIKWLSSSYLSVSLPKEKKDLKHLTKPEVLQIVSDAYDIGLAAHKILSAAQLDEKVSFFAGPMTRRQILILMHDHQTHHLGQLIVYLRLKNITPPDYVGW